MKPLCDIIIPTWNNPGLLASCVNSFDLTLFGPLRALTRLIIVNNGRKESLDAFKPSERTLILHAGENIGWEGGLKLGLAHSTAPFVAFANDDIRLPPGTKDWLWRMLSFFNDPKVAAVGPASNYVMGPQNIFADINEKHLDVRFLIGFFMLLRRSALDAAGGVDDSLPGGDDIDLSIRLRDCGYRLLCLRDIFIFHHGQATGARLHEGYWNSPQMQHKTNLALIRKHGMTKFWETLVMGWREASTYSPWQYADKDREGELCAMAVRGEAVLELGCGGRKTVPQAVAVDILPSGATVHFVSSETTQSRAEIVADASVALPCESGSQDSIIARHLLEHCQDTLAALAMWNRALKPGGRLIIAVPNQELANTILMNPEHVVSFTPDSLRSLAAVCGFAQVSAEREVNGVSFVSVFDKVGEPSPLILSPRPTIAPQAARLEEAIA